MSTEKEAPLIAQLANALVTAEAEARADLLASALAAQDLAFEKALQALEVVRSFVGTPEHILGNAQTKHGEIAERVEVGVRRAWDYLVRHTPTATFEGVGRTAPHDYVIDGTVVQSKFINGARNTLDAVLAHYRENPSFQAADPFYHVPRDQFAQLNRLLQGELPEEMSAHSASALLGKVREIETLTGRPFADVVRPSLSTYGEVQQGRVHETLERHEAELEHADEVQREEALAASGPTLGGVAAATAKGALVGAGIRFAAATYEKVREGKNPLKGEFCLADWRDVGISAATGSAQGGIAAGAIFALTNYSDLSAPFAGAFVSSAMAVGSLARSYRNGEISLDELVDLGQIACSEAALVGIATAVGQAAIPIPALGALVGAVAGRLLVAGVKRFAEGETERVRLALHQRFSACMAALQDAEQQAVEQVLGSLDRLGELTVAAFDLQLNGQLLLQASVALAVAHGVDSDLILRSTDDVDRFMRT